MSGPTPGLCLDTPFGRAFIRLPSHIQRGLLEESIAPVQTDGELLLELCYQQVDPKNARGDEFTHLVQLEDATLGWTSTLVRYSAYFEDLVDRLLAGLPQPLDVNDRTETVKAVTHLLTMVPAGKASWRYTPNETDYSIQDRASWHTWSLEPPVVPLPIAKWRHWRPSNTKNDQPITQRRLEQELRERWAMKLIAHLAPFAQKIPSMAAVRGPNQDREFLDLLGDTRFRTLRIYCLGLENLHKLGFTNIPWTESDVRDLLNILRDQETTPHKIQRVWDTLKWFSKKFGFLDVDQCDRLQMKKKAIQEDLVDTVSKPQRKASLPSKDVVWALEEIASGGWTTTAVGVEGCPPVALMDQYICHHPFSDCL